MNQRIRLLRKALGLSQCQFGEKIGLTQTTQSTIENGKSSLTDKNIKLICSIFNVNEAWIRTGMGEMFSSSLYETEFTNILKNLTPESQEYLLLMAKELFELQQYWFTVGTENEEADPELSNEE